MVNKNSQNLADRICHYYEKIVNKDRKLTYLHFSREGIAKGTICRILKRYELSGTSTYKKSPGRPVKKMTSKVIKKVDENYKTQPNVSERSLARKLNLSKTTLHRIKVDKLNLKTYKATTTPKYTAKQEARAKTNCRKILEKMLSNEPSKILIIDDETYCPIDPSDIPSQKTYTCRNKDDVPIDVKVKPKRKYGQQYLVWQCLDETGNVSKPFITDSTMDSETYLNSCIKKILIPFISGRNVLFWPDMAPCHYASKVTEYFRCQNIDFVEKNKNAPNVPQARPIERFWALCKAEYRQRKEPAKNLRSFKRIWANISKKVAEKSGKTLMTGVRKKLRQIGRGGVYEPIKGLK